MWVLDLQAEITSDFSVFHGIRDPLRELASPRYFDDVALLHHYGGAVTAARAQQQQQQQPPQRTVEAPQVPVTPYLGQPAAGGDRPVVVDDVATLAALANNDGFPGIEYRPGG